MFNCLVHFKLVGTCTKVLTGGDDKTARIWKACHSVVPVIHKRNLAEVNFNFLGKLAGKHEYVCNVHLLTFWLSF